MTTEQITIINAANNTQIERPLNEQELAQRELDRAAVEDEATALAAKSTAREALLDKLGITAEEAQLLLGGI